MFAVQIAKALGARVSATASARDSEYVRALGADEVVDYKVMQFEQVVSDVDVVLDPIGGTTTERSIGVIKDGGTLITLPGPPQDTIANGRNVSVRFFIVEADRAQLVELGRLVDAGEVRVEVAEVFRWKGAGRLRVRTLEPHQGQSRLGRYGDGLEGPRDQAHASGLRANER